MNYPEPVFDMSAGRESEGKLSGFTDRISSIVDGFGKKASDSIVKKLTGSMEPIELDEDDFDDLDDGATR